MELTLDELKAATSAAHAEANRVFADTLGAKINTVSVSGIQGSHVVSVSITSANCTGKEVAEALERASAVLEMASRKAR